MARKRRSYKNGAFKDCDRYTGSGPGPCNSYPPDRLVAPERGSAPLRIGTRDFQSFFQGAIRNVRIWNRALSADEVSALCAELVPQAGLVAAYLLQQDIAVDSAGPHDGGIVGATWVPSG
jgi:hypothetical protein